MLNLLENKYGSEVGAKDGGFIFQAIISHTIEWEIENGQMRFDPAKISAMLHQLDIFPDMRFTEGDATLTYVILSEVGILKRKFEMATEFIKKRLIPAYGEELKNSNNLSGISAELNQKHFDKTFYSVKLSTNRLVLREVSSSGINSGKPDITLKLSTGMVDTLNGQPTASWEAINVVVKGSSDAVIGGTDESIAAIKVMDPVENVEDVIFQTIVPSLVLNFRGDSVAIDTYTNRSAQSIIDSQVNYDTLFVLDKEDLYATGEEEPIETEEEITPEEEIEKEAPKEEEKETPKEETPAPNTDNTGAKESEKEINK